MLLIKDSTRTIYRNSAHFLPIVLGNFHVNDDLDVKFDTGAAATVVGISKLYPEYDITVDDEDEQRKINEELQRSVDSKFSKLYSDENKISTFKSATNTPMKSILIKQPNVKIGCLEVPVFYYWLVLQVNVKRFLLGDDFINFCDYKHNHDDCIVISNFFYEDYIKNVKKTVEAFTQDEISELLGDNFDFAFSNVDSHSDK